MLLRLLLIMGFLGQALPLAADEIAVSQRLPSTLPLTETGDLSAKMRAGIRQFLLRQTEQSVASRAALWRRDFTSREAYERSIAPNRARFRHYIGVVDELVPISALEYIATTSTPAEVACTERYSVHAVRWPVLEGVDAEGLLLRPKGRPRAAVVALPDADQTPEMLVGLAAGIASEHQFARRLVEAGCLVLVPTLIDRQDTWSGSPRVWMTNQPHREWIYRPAFVMGRHIIGYEVQKVLAAIDWFRHAQPHLPIGIAGHTEGGLLALYSSAIDPRIGVTLVSGYFDSRQRLAEEPLYRNVFGLLHEFGDAEIASLIAPRPLLIEHSEAPRIDGPPAAREGRRATAAPGRIRTPEFASVRAEHERVCRLCPDRDGFHPSIQLFAGVKGETVGPGSEPALRAFLEALGLPPSSLLPVSKAPVDARTAFDPSGRQRRQVAQLIEHTQKLVRQSPEVRQAFWAKARATSPQEWHRSCTFYREHLREEVIGRFGPPSVSARARSRKILDRPKWTGYEVVLDVWPDVFVWGLLLVPKDLEPGEKRPVVVCQHGLEGLPMDVVTDDPKTPAFGVYKAFAAQLAERGFVTFAPHNFYRGGNEFRQLQRLANPLKKTLFAVTVAQHERLLDWLGQLPFVDGARIGFYGLSYGGNTAVRVPPLLEGYALSISSADFNEWIAKAAGTTEVYSLPLYPTYEAHEFNLGNTFGHAELAGLMAPRPFMVERGHGDSVAPDEWVAAEYAKVRRLYSRLGLPERTAIDFFDGPHAIHGQETFAFLHKHLHWPARKRP
jgi:dienelactone hydrolase